MTRALLLLFLIAAGCLPQVGPPVDGGAGGGGGAESCAPCATGADCGSSLDCASGLCASGRCAEAATTCGAFAGCGSFVETTDGGTPTVRFPSGNNRYSPGCLRVRFGQSVVFEGGDFSTHTLAQGCGPVSGAIGASSGQRFTVTFDRALGVYGYYCTQHGAPSGSGMAGAIEVVR